jgi:hypothetical protein
MPERHDHDPAINLDFIGYDELGRLPTVGRTSDDGPPLDLPDGTLRPKSDEPRRSGPREFLANDFALGGF